MIVGTIMIGSEATDEKGLFDHRRSQHKQPPRTRPVWTVTIHYQTSASAVSKNFFVFSLLFVIFFHSAFHFHLLLASHFRILTPIITTSTENSTIIWIFIIIQCLYQTLFVLYYTKLRTTNHQMLFSVCPWYNMHTWAFKHGLNLGNQATPTFTEIMTALCTYSQSYFVNHHCTLLFLLQQHSVFFRTPIFFDDVNRSVWFCENNHVVWNTLKYLLICSPLFGSIFFESASAE